MTSTRGMAWSPSLETLVLGLGSTGIRKWLLRETREEKKLAPVLRRAQGSKLSADVSEVCTDIEAAQYRQYGVPEAVVRKMGQTARPAWCG